MGKRKMMNRSSDSQSFISNGLLDVGDPSLNELAAAFPCRNHHWATEPPRFAFGVTFTYDESKLRELSESWSIFFKKFVEDYKKMDFRASVPTMARAERLSKSEIFVYWINSDVGAYNNTLKEWQLWRDLLNAFPWWSSTGICDVARECGIRKLYIHKVASVRGDSWDSFPNDYLRDLDDNDVLSFETTVARSGQVKIEPQEPPVFVEESKAFMKEEETERKPLELIVSDDNSASKPKYHWDKTKTKGQGGSRRKRPWQHPGKETAEAALDNRLLNSSCNIREKKIKNKHVQGSNIEDITGQTKGNVVSDAEKKLGKKARRTARKREREAKRLALRQPMLLVDPSNNMPQLVTVGEYLSMLTQSALALGSIGSNGVES